jgi:uncharacterized membrane protein
MDPIDDLRNYKLGIFYYNTEDPRTIVPKRHRMMGYQMNFARPINVFLALLILVLIGILTTV